MGWRGCILGLALLAVPQLALAQTAAEEERDRGFLVGLIEDNLSSVSRTVTIDGFRGALSSQASIETLSIADAEGVWLRAEGLVLDWNRTALFRGQIAVNELSAARITLLRPPVAEPAPPSPEAVPFALPELPVSISIGTMEVSEFALGAGFLGEDVLLRIAGAAQLAGGEGVVDITATRLDGAAGDFVIEGSYSNATRILALQVNLSEEPGGIAARVLGIPGRPSVDLVLAGTGPLDDYTATLSVATDGTPRITGEAGLVTVAAANGTAPGQEFRLNISGDVTALTEARYHPFFGTDTRLTVQGARDGAGDLTLRRIEVVTGALDLRGQAVIGADGWPQRLRLQGRVGAADGTPVVLPVGGADTTVQRMTLDVDFDTARGDAWTGNFVMSDFARDGITIPVLSLDGSGVIVPASQTAPGRLSVNVDYGAVGLALDDPGLAAALGRNISGRISMARDDAGPFRISRLTLTGPGIDITAEGTVAGPEDRFLTQSSVMLTAADLSRFATLTGLDLAGAAEVTIVSGIRPLDGMFDLVVTGGTTDLALGIAEADPLLQGAGQITIAAARDEAGTRISTLSVVTPAISATGNLDLTSGASAAVFDLTVTDAGLSLPGMQGPATLRGTLARDAAGLLSLETQADLPGSTARITATTARADGPVTAAITARISDLAIYAGLADRPLTGSAAVQIDGTVEQDGSLFDLTMTAETANLAIGEAQIDPLLAGAGRLSARILRPAPGALRIEDLQLATDGVTLAASVTQAEGTTAAVLDGRLADVAPFAAGLSGPVTLAGTVAQGPDGILALDLTAGHAGGVVTVDGTLDPDAGPTDAGPTADAPVPPVLAFAGSLRAMIPDLATYAPAIAPLTGGMRPAGAVDLTLTGSVRSDLAAVDLVVDGTTRNLGIGSALADPMLAGQGNVAGRILRTGPDDAAVQDLRITTPMIAARIDGTLTDGVGTADLDLSLTDVAPLAPGLSGPAQVAGTLALAADGRITAALGATAPGTTATLEATMGTPDEGRRTTLALAVDAASLAPFSALAGRPLSGTVNATLTGFALPDASAFDLTLAARATNPDAGIPAVATLLRGSGMLDARVLREGGTGLTVEGFRLTFPNLVVTADLQGRDNAGSGRFDARLADIALFAPDFSGPVTATGTATRDGAGNWQIATDASGPGGTALRATGIVAGPGALDLAITGAAPLGFANGFIEPRRIEGTAALDLRLRGPAAVEALSGTVTLSNGRLAAPTLREALTDLAGTVTLAGGQARLALGGALENGGQITLEGPVGVTAPFAADLRLAGRGLVLRDPALYQTTAEVALTIAGPLAGGARIAGTVDLAETEVRVPSSPVGALGALPTVTHLGAPSGVAQTLDRAGLTLGGAEVAAGNGGGGGAAYGLDILVRAPARVFVRGRGLDAELGGQIAITGTTAQPIPIGQIDLIRGRLDILNQRFDLTEGGITLAGDFLPFLRLVARTTAQTGTVVSIIIEGPANEPEVMFRSQPELPQDEVLAQLIFGRDLSQISPLQAVQLAAAVATLAGRGGGGLIEGFRSGLGVDDFDIAADADGNAALRVGAYLSENIYTDVTVGTTETEINLNLDLTDDVVVKGSVSSLGDTALGIYFERDY